MTFPDNKKSFLSSKASSQKDVRCSFLIISSSLFEIIFPCILFIYARPIILFPFDALKRTLPLFLTCQSEPVTTSSPNKYYDSSSTVENGLFLNHTSQGKT